MIAEFRDYLKTLNVATYYYIGKIENAKEEVLGIYADNPTVRVESVGKNSSYGTYGVRLLLHWNKNARETEAQALSLFEAIRYIQDVDMTTGTGQTASTVHVKYIDWDYDAPVFLGTDANGVYEYVIDGMIYYRKDK